MEQVNGIIQDYENKKIRIKEIQNKYGITAYEMYLILDEYKVPRRLTKVTEEEKEKIVEVYTNCEITNVATETKRAYATIGKIIKEREIDFRKPKSKQDEKTLKKIIDYYKSGIQMKDIAKILGVSTRCVEYNIYAYADKVKAPRVTNEEKEKIISEIKKSKLKNCEIAKKYNRSNSLISILRKEI